MAYKETRCFHARDAHGNVYTVIEMQEEGTVRRPFSGPRIDPGKFMLATGDPVNFVGDDTFRIVRNGIIIRPV